MNPRPRYQAAVPENVFSLIARSRDAGIVRTRRPNNSEGFPRPSLRDTARFSESIRPYLTRTLSTLDSDSNLHNWREKYRAEPNTRAVRASFATDGDRIIKQKVSVRESTSLYVPFRNTFGEYPMSARARIARARAVLTSASVRTLITYTRTVGAVTRRAN